MAFYTVHLRSDEAPTARVMGRWFAGDLAPGDVVTVDGYAVLVETVDGTRAECRRLWLFQLVDRSSASIGSGSVLIEQRHYGDVETIVLDGADRFRVLRAITERHGRFDGTFVVERA